MNEDIISVSNLVKAFSGKRAVDNLSFSVPAGSLFAFLGQNGAGKSTTINMLMGLLKKDSGKIRYSFAGTSSEVRRKIGVVFQNNIFDGALSVEENLRLYGTLYLHNSAEVTERCRKAAELTGLGDFIKRRFGTLSGGQQRKAEIARALLTIPQVLFLDEPTTGLDPKTRAEVWQIIHDIRKNTGMTVFLTTHYMEEAADADRIVIISRGKCICEGSPAELKTKYSYDRLLVTPLKADYFEIWLQNRGLSFVKISDT